MQYTLEEAKIKLNKRLEFFQNEVHRLQMDMILKDSPMARLHIEENIEEAHELIKAHELAIEAINSGKVTEKDLTSDIESESFNIEKFNKEVSISKNTFVPQNSDNNTGSHWYKNPIGIIGLTVISGVILAMVLYLINKYLEIPL